MAGRGRYREGEYQRLADRASRGDYDLVVPLDYLIIDALHDEGELLGGYYPVGDTVAQLRKKHFSELTSDQLSARLRALMTQGIVVRVKGVGTSGNYLWQRTTTGKELLQQWQQTQKERA